MKRKLLLILLIVVILEATLFNINSYRIFNNKNMQEFVKKDFEYVKEYEDQTFIKISNINSEIKTIHIELNTKENVEYQVLYTDETSSSFKELPSKIYIDSYENSKYLPCYLSGKTDEITVKFFSNEIDIKKITINEKIPFNFNFLRVFILFVLISFIYSINTQEIFQKPFSIKNFKQDMILNIILVCFIILIDFICTYSTNEIESLDYYSKDFVSALAKGQVYFEEKPSEKLINLENPYDTQARVDNGLIRGEDFLWDVAYYNGNYYMYFGILPAILMLPYHLITGNFISTMTMVLIFSYLTAISIKLLISNIFSRFFKEVSFKYLIYSYLILLFGSHILWLDGIPRFYELAIISALFFAITGINFMFNAINENTKHRYINVFLSCLMLSLAVACRPTQLFTSIIIIPILLKMFIDNVKNRKDIIKLILVVAIPYMLVGITLMYYNYIRFENIFEFGSSYQLTINNMSKLENRFMTIGMGIICNLFSVPIFIPNFPFMYNHNNLLTFYGYYYIENVMGGLFILAPICFSVFSIFKLYKNCKKKDLLKFITICIVTRYYNVCS